jgi:hypothetical protein
MVSPTHSLPLQWVETLVVSAGQQRRRRRRAVFGDATAVKTLASDYALRNLLISNINNDGWIYQLKSAVGNQNVNTFVMPSPVDHKPHMMCVKGYATFPMPPTEIADRMWDFDGRLEWDLFLDPKFGPAIIQTVEEPCGGGVVTHSGYKMPYPFEPSPVWFTNLQYKWLHIRSSVRSFAGLTRRYRSTRPSW